MKVESVNGILPHHIDVVIRNCPSHILSENREEICAVRGGVVPFIEMMNSIKKAGSFITIGVRRLDA